MTLAVGVWFSSSTPGHLVVCRAHRLNVCVISNRYFVLCVDEQIYLSSTCAFMGHKQHDDEEIFACGGRGGAVHFSGVDSETVTHWNGMKGDYFWEKLQPIH